MFKLLLLVAAVLGGSHCLRICTPGYNYRLKYGGQFIPVKIDQNSISFVGCNQNTGTMQSDDNRRGFKVKNFKDNDKFKVTSWKTDKENTCEVDNDEKIKGELNRVTRKK